MRTIYAKEITRAVTQLCLKANFSLSAPVLRSLKAAYRSEKMPRAKAALGMIIKNAGIAQKEKIALCQDTGMPVVFLEIGRDLHIKGDLNKAVNRGVFLGYKKGFFRESIVADPLKRGKSSYYGSVMHVSITGGSRMKITVMPKGFGCENKSLLNMFLPTAEANKIKDFIVEAVKLAGPDACPPYTVGVGIGGTADHAAFLAKKALLRNGPSSKAVVRAMEKELLSKINKLRIGPMGLGGGHTCLAVNVETYPTHIAGLPVAVNISCHALRSATLTL